MKRKNVLLIFLSLTLVGSSFARRGRHSPEEFKENFYNNLSDEEKATFDSLSSEEQHDFVHDKMDSLHEEIKTHFEALKNLETEEERQAYIDANLSEEQKKILERKGPPPEDGTTFRGPPPSGDKAWNRPHPPREFEEDLVEE